MAEDRWPLDGLGALLEEERRLILSGDYRGLEPLTEQKAALLAVIDTVAESAERRDLARLARAARRNQTLLVAASEGLRAAMRRLAELQNLHSGRGTYGAGGQRNGAVEGVRIERRL